MQTRKHRYTCRQEALIMVDQLPLRPRRASANTTLDRDVSFDERSHKLTTFAVESFGHLGVEVSYFIDQLAASVVGGRDGGSMARKGMLKERLLQIVSVTTQAAISRRASHFKLQLRDCQMQEVSGEGMIDPHPWRGDGVWTRSRNLKGILIGYWYVIRRVEQGQQVG